VPRDNGFDSAQRGSETIEKLRRKILDDAPERQAAIQALPGSPSRTLTTDQFQEQCRQS
jgi:hypothetical protein